MELKRVVITGLGALTPIGNTVDEYWDSLKAGVSGAAKITRFDAESLKRNLPARLKTLMLMITLIAGKQED